MFEAGVNGGPRRGSRGARTNYLFLEVYTLPKEDACVVDIGGEDVGDLSDRDEDDAVVLPLDQRFRIFLVTLLMTMGYVITLFH
jgi:hypothetical protein